MSSASLVIRYLAQRARLGVFVPLALAMAYVAHAFASVQVFLTVAAQSLLLALAFRVWDDLEDRSRDAREHPERVLVTSNRTMPFVLLALLLAVAGITPSVASPRALLALSLAAAVLLAWYRLRGANANGLVSGHVVLLKYPAIVLAVAPLPPSIFALASLYLALCAYEAFDDPVMRASMTARRIALTELALVPLLIASASLLGGSLS